MNFNEENQRQAQRGANGTETGSQAFQTQDDAHGKESPCDISPGTTTNCPDLKEIVVDKVQGVVSQFLQKRETEAAKYLKIIESMLGNYDSYHWAEPTLSDIYDFIEANRYITKRQIKVIENIKNYYD